MNNELSLLVKDIPQDDVELFSKNTVATIDAKKVVDKITIDYSWVDVLDESIPYLDNIIRNPRRFIVSEEDIVPIEKTKKVAEESIKHLAVHTNLIQDVDEDGMVKPIKLLNVFKEETIDLYENRFVYSLITNLYTFVREQMTYEEQSASNKEERSVHYEANTSFDNRTVNIKLDLVSSDRDRQNLTEEMLEERKEKIKHICEVLEDFMASKFMKMMANATPVRSPIRKTNVILKEQNFIKALQLWEFLESYQVEKPVREEKENVDLTSSSLSKNFNMTYFLNYCVLYDIVSTDGTLVPPEKIDFSEALYDYAKEFDVDDKELRKQLNDQLTKAENYKQLQKNEAKKCYDAFIENHNARIAKALLLFR